MLDLDSFLNSQKDNHRRRDDGGDDDEENWTSFPHRTIEEILKESLSDSSPSPPPSSPPSSPQRQDHPSIGGSSDTLRSPVSPPPPQPRPSSLPVDKESTSSDSRLKPPNPVLWASSSSRQLPSLFGGVRSNAKPGAVLAAASRLLPTPHAAALKSRRALLTASSSSSFPSISSSQDSLDSSVDPLHGLDSQLRLQHRTMQRTTLVSWANSHPL